MKRLFKKTAILLSIFLTFNCLSLSAGCSSQVHKHDFNKQIVEETYLQSKATCTTKATYYYACECGEKGSETFENGDFFHDYGEWTSLGEEKHTRYCILCSAQGEVVDCYGGTFSCTERMKCIDCGTEYGEFDGPKEHVEGEWVSQGDGLHVKHCTVCNKKLSTKRCNGGTATCTKKAVCTTCGGEYGELVAHVYSTELSCDDEMHWRECVCGKRTSEQKHSLNAFSTCTSCFRVVFDDNLDVVELGIPTIYLYNGGDTRNCAWDTYYYNGKIYRGGGDYDKNTTTFVWSYNIENRQWVKEITTSDGAIHRFVEIDDKLMTPGVDADKGWDYGNYYVLDENGWMKYANVPDGVHVFDMVEYDGKIFFGLGINWKKVPLAYTEDGENFTVVNFYKDGSKLSTSSSAAITPVRVYETFTFNGDLYCLMQYRGENEIYRYEDGKMQYVSNVTDIPGAPSNFNHWTAKCEFNGKLYISGRYLYQVTDFDTNAIKKIDMPNKEMVVDFIIKDGKGYALSYLANADGSYKTVIYESATMEAGSFVEVKSFDYGIVPLTFDKAGDDFYVSMGGRYSTSSGKNGILLRVKGK